MRCKSRYCLAMVPRRSGPLRRRFSVSSVIRLLDTGIIGMNQSGAIEVIVEAFPQQVIYHRALTEHCCPLPRGALAGREADPRRFLAGSFPRLRLTS